MSTFATEQATAAATDTPALNPRDQADLIAPWKTRKTAATQDRKQYERGWQICQMFAAGVQHLQWSTHDNRVLEHPQNLQRPTADVLDQYLKSAIGMMAADDFRPEEIFEHDDTQAETYGSQINDAIGWGWEHEWQGDRQLLRVLRYLGIIGTAAVQCRYDRSQGAYVGDMPHRGKRPITDLAEARTYVADRQRQGLSANIRAVREGQVAWPALSAWNLLPPPGIEDSSEFPWELIVRAVHLDALIRMYGPKAKQVKAADIQAMNVLGIGAIPSASGGVSGQSPAVAGKLEEHALVYTGFLRPTAEYPKGHSIVFTHDDHLLDFTEGLPYSDAPYGPRSGITYFRWTTLPHRFWGRPFIEAGIGPQKVRNKRLGQIDEIIDRGLPKAWVQEGSVKRMPKGGILEAVELEIGAPKPVVDSGVPVGGWMFEDVKQQDDNARQALGLTQIDLGSAPPGVSAYSALSLISEKDAQKLETISQDFRLNVAALMRDTIEAMKQWPPNKQVLIAGDDNRLQAVTFNAAQAIPAAYMVRPAKGGTLPRSQAAEIQKIADLWNAAVVCGAVQQNPGEWIEWYKSSLDAGKALDLPESTPDWQTDMAQNENVLMAQGQQVPIHDYDDPQVHVPVHRELQAALGMAAAQGDQQAVQLALVVVEHIQGHLAQAEQNIAEAAAHQQQLAQTAPGGDQQMQTYDNTRAIRYENQVQSPMPQRLR